MLPQAPQRWQVTKVVLGLSQLTSVHLQWTSSCSLPASDRNLSVSAPQRRAYHCWEIQLRARTDDNRGACHQLLATVVCSMCSQSRWLSLILSFYHVMTAVIVVHSWLVHEITGLIRTVGMYSKKKKHSVYLWPAAQYRTINISVHYEVPFPPCLGAMQSQKTLAVTSNQCIRTKTLVTIHSSW